MKRFQRTIAVVMAGALALALALSGCGTPGATGSTGGTVKDGTVKVNPPGTYPVVDEKITITAMISLPTQISDLVDNSFTKALEEKTNVHLDLRVTPSEGYAEKLKLALSTGDYPEMIMSGAAANNNEIRKYGMDEKIYIPLNKYIDEYSEHILARFKEMPSLREIRTAPDGNIYALGTTEGGVGHGAVSYKSWVNTEWLKKLGLEKPTTTEEYKNMLIAFKTQDPNGNGVADEIPLSGAIKTWSGEPYYYLLNAFDYFNLGLRLKDGKFTFDANTQGFKDGLKYIHDLYKEGLLDPAALTQDEAQMARLGSSNPPIVGNFTCGHVGMAIDINNLEISKQYDYLLPLQGPTGYRGLPTVTKSGSQGGGFALTDKCKNPAAAIRVIDQRYEYETAMSSRFGPKGEAWDLADPGAKGVTGMDAVWKQLSGMDVSGTTEPKNNYWHSATIWGFPKDWKDLCQFEGDIFDSANYEPRLSMVTNEYKKYMGDGEQIMPMWNDEKTGSYLSNTITPIQDYVQSFIAQFITGQKDIDKDWDEYVQGLDKLGLQEYIKTYQEAYFKK